MLIVVTKTHLPLRISHGYQPSCLLTILIDHYVYWPSCQSTIVNCAYCPSCLSNIVLLTIMSINHCAYHSSCLSTIMPLNHQSFYPLIIMPYQPYGLLLWLPFVLFTNKWSEIFNILGDEVCKVWIMNVLRTQCFLL